MASAIVTLITVAVVLAGVALMSQSTFTSMKQLSDAWKQMEVTSGEITRTALEVVSTNHAPPQVDVTLRNAGQTSLLDFELWDVIAQYYENNGTYHVVHLTYTSSPVPGDNQWTVEGIYIDAGASTPEVFQPNILDPSEEIVVRMKLAPGARSPGQNLAVVSAPNGVSALTML